MLRWARKAALFALLLVMPLQGLAWAVAPFACAAVGEHGAQASPAHDGHAHSHGTSAHHDEHTGGAGDLAKHLDCHPLFSGAPAVYKTHVTSQSPVFRSTVCLMATLFIPESPQRPPRS